MVKCMLKAYLKFMSTLEKIALFVVGILMIIMVTAMVYQVILRYIFSNSNIWSEELTRFLFVWVSLIGSFIAVRRNSHLKVEVFIDLMKGNTKRYFSIIIDIAVLAFLIYLLPLSYDLTMSTFVNISAGLKVPMAVGYGAIPVGTVLMILGMIEQLLLKITNTEPVKEAEVKE